MFSNFKDAFIRKPQFTARTPKAVLDVLSKNLPRGFRYVEDHDGFCRLDCDGVMDFNPICIRFPDEAKPLFDQKEDFTMNDVVSYVYNSQKNLEVVPDQDGCYTVNGQKIEADKFMIAPMKNLQLKNGRMYIIAPPFPKPVPIEVAGNGFSLILMIQRQPMNSITEIKMETVKEAALDVKLSFDPTKDDGMKISIKMCSFASAFDVLASKEIFNAFIQGKGTLCGMPIKSNGSNQINIVPDEVIQFWHRIVEVEEVMDVKFDVSQEITFDDIKKIEEFYRCFIKKEPFKTYLRDNTLRGIGEFDRNKIEIGKEILFEYIERIQMELLGATLQYSALVSVFDGSIDEIQEPKDNTSGEFFIRLLPTKGKQMYSSTQYYLEEEAPIVVQEDHNHIQKFQLAKELNDED